MSTKQRLALIEMFGHLPFSIVGDIAEQRVAMDRTLMAAPLPDEVTLTRGELGGVPVVNIDTEGSDPSRVVLHFHGGVYVLGSARAAAGLAAALGRHAGVRTTAVDYRLAPEHPYPAAIDDALAVYRALLDQTPGSQIALSGESSGGGLAIALLLKLKEAGLQLPASAVLFSPWVDLTLSGTSMATKASVDPSVLSPEGLRLRVPDYVGDSDPTNPLISPIFADLSGLPPLLIQAGSYEILLDDAVRLAAQAAAHDVEVTLQVTPEVPHVFQAFSAILDEGETALRSAGSFLRMHFEHTDQPEER
jgi:acetyl esterase/lipase